MIKMCVMMMIKMIIEYRSKKFLVPIVLPLMPKQVFLTFFPKVR